MTVDRTMFAPMFSALPAWRCPSCGKGHLTVRDGDLLNKETGPSRAAHNHEAWDPAWITRRFAGLMTCSLSSCGEIVAVLGDVRVFEDGDDDVYEPKMVFSDFLRPVSISPAPLLIQPPVGTPDLVEGALREASGLIWQSAEGAANQVRQAVEHLMDHQGVTSSLPGAFLSLHNRIKEFEKKDAANAEILLAVKWLGNSGSHAGGLTRDDVFDAFDMVEYVLTNLFDTTAATIMAKAKAINTQKGPVKPAPPYVTF